MRRRSSYPKPFKAQVVQECLQPGATVSSVAINHGINANVIRKWLPLYRDQPAAASLPAFVPLKAAPKRQVPLARHSPRLRGRTRQRTTPGVGVGPAVAARRCRRCD
ncbi:IS66-like element accessory protein TnpA [Pseudomonas entomophila]|uniref:IS66-like element accessory protein TnpA n=1 Tax=Pseudomonas entomophila TaxID=312306 RepID=UPI003D80A547